jgi:hypothetical protein
MAIDSIVLAEHSATFTVASDPDRPDRTREITIRLTFHGKADFVDFQQRYIQPSTSYIRATEQSETADCLFKELSWALFGEYDEDLLLAVAADKNGLVLIPEITPILAPLGFDDLDRFAAAIATSDIVDSSEIENDSLTVHLSDFGRGYAQGVQTSGHRHNINTAVPSVECMGFDPPCSITWDGAAG